MEAVEPEPSTTGLKVHGGGGLALAGSEMFNLAGFGILDSHVLDAAPRARISPEDKLMREVARRREVELERRARIFDAKRRTIGVDKPALDAQVAQHENQKQEQLQKKREEGSEVKELDRQLKLMEAEKREVHRSLEKECREFSRTNLSKEQTREFDIHDPLANRKGKPARVGDDDPRCGPASLQKFNGEDLYREERIRQQQLQQRSFIEQQMYEKAMLLEQNGDAAHAEELKQMIEICNDIEQKEHTLRRELQRNQQDTNLSMADQYAQERQARRDHEAALEAKELQHHATDAFLNENGPDRGYGRRDRFKGRTRDERVQNRHVLEDQAVEQDVQRFEDRLQERQVAAQMEGTRRNLVLIEREKQRARRAMAEEIARENLKMREEKVDRTKVLNELYTNKFSEDFFQQFGRAIR